MKFTLRHSFISEEFKILALQKKSNIFYSNIVLSVGHKAVIRSVFLSYLVNIKIQNNLWFYLKTNQPFWMSFAFDQIRSLQK